jgi:hypothetical protein
MVCRDMMSQDVELDAVLNLNPQDLRAVHRFLLSFIGRNYFIFPLIIRIQASRMQGSSSPWSSGFRQAGYRVHLPLDHQDSDKQDAGFIFPLIIRFMQAGCRVHLPLDHQDWCKQDAGFRV